MGLPISKQKKRAENKIDTLFRDMNDIDDVCHDLDIVRAEDYEPDLCKVVLYAMAKGLDRDGAAGALCVSKQTFEDWEHKYPDFKKAIEVGQSLNSLYWQKQGIKNLVYTPTGKQINSKVYAMNMAARFGWGEVKEEKKREVGVLAFTVRDRPNYQKEE